MAALNISIHALREEGDSGCPHYPDRPHISIHALREEGDIWQKPNAMPESVFLSTPSARRATSPRYTLPARVKNFYPRPPRGGRPSVPVSTTALNVFLSTPSARRATSTPSVNLTTEIYFYPRPPRGGRRQTEEQPKNDGNFYPRPPRGGRQFSGKLTVSHKVFLSTPSARRATVWRDMRKLYGHISIHALREEGDDQRPDVLHEIPHFYPRPPRGGRRRRSPLLSLLHYISIHALREEGDRSTK